MREMMIKQALRSREPLVGYWLAIAHPTAAEIVAHAGVDFVVVDGEHTDSSFETIASMVRAVESTRGPIVPLVRVSGNDASEIKRVLDLGARGIVVPMVDTASEAAAAVEALRVPPAGRRGVAGSRAADWGTHLDSYLETANDELVTIVQIESDRAVSNVDAIAAVDGVDGTFIGPVDLSASLGVYGQWNNPEFTDAVERIVTESHAAETSVGTLVGSPDRIPERLDWGVDFMVAGTDKATLAAGVREGISTYRDSLGAC